MFPRRGSDMANDEVLEMLRQAQIREADAPTKRARPDTTKKLSDESAQIGHHMVELHGGPTDYVEFEPGSLANLSFVEKFRPPNVYKVMKVLGKQLDAIFEELYRRYREKVKATLSVKSLENNVDPVVARLLSKPRVYRDPIDVDREIAIFEGQMAKRLGSSARFKSCGWSTDKKELHCEVSGQFKIDI